MKKLLLIICIAVCKTAMTQSADSTSLLKEIAATSCKCIDSISVYNKSKEDVNKEVHACIDDQVGAYQLTNKLMGIDLDKDVKDKKGKKEVNISINLDKNSADYKNHYYQIERYLMANCPALKSRIASNDKQNDKSLSSNPAALAIFQQGVEASKKEDCKEAIRLYKEALKIDSQFAFAWDNLGLCYRRLGEYDNALAAYQKSLEVDPNGLMPLQNSAIVYQYKKDYPKAIEMYEKLALVQKNNPEVYYGIGQIYAIQLQDNEKALSNLCKAYNLYIEIKSPYRTDAEKLISYVYGQMKKEGKEQRFSEILKEHNIKTQ